MKLLLVLCGIFYLTTNGIGKEQEKGKYDPCCFFPCQHMGFCMSSGQEYQCDCTRTGYYGQHCETPYLSTWLKSWITPSKQTIHFLLTHFNWIWQIINNVEYLHKTLMKAVLLMRIVLVDDPNLYHVDEDYISWNAHSNMSVYGRTIPPVPRNCPTPMGAKGKKILPDPDVLVEKFFLRKKFRPCDRRTSLVFPFFAQHFTHQFFKTDFKKGFPIQWGSQEVDMSHVYGGSYQRQHALRSHVDGKMKVSIINGEVFPPTVDQANVSMIGEDRVEPKYRFAIGHPAFLSQPTFLFMGTIWLREHNRVCDILKREHPQWDDERLFQTTRLVIIGELIKIVIEDYVQHLSGYNFNLVYDPTLMHEEPLSYHNKIHVEFTLLYHWHAFMPDYLYIQNETLSIKDLLFNPKPFVEAGMEKWIHDISNQFSNKAGGVNNQGQATIAVAKQAILDGRKLRLQSLNRYRERFGVKPYESFSEFIEDPELAKELEELYGHIDAVEYFPGILLEKPAAPLLWGETLTDTGATYSLKGLFGNPVSSARWWKPSTFGGEVGFNIIKTTRIADLFCRNIKGCPKVSFVVPPDVSFKPVTMHNDKKDDTSNILLDIAHGNVQEEEHKRTDKEEDLSTHEQNKAKTEL